jgi:hypothetical protein
MLDGTWFYLVIVALLLGMMCVSRVFSSKRSATKNSRTPSKYQLQDFVMTRMGGLSQESSSAPSDYEGRELTAIQRRLQEAWYRYGSIVLTYWNEEEHLSPASWPERSLPVRRATDKELKRLGIECIELPALSREGMAQDVLSLLRKPTHEQVSYLRAQALSASRFNQTTAYIHITRDAVAQPDAYDRWKMRRIDPINICAAKFFSLDPDPRQINFQFEEILRRHQAEPHVVQRWQEVKEFLLCVERGDYADILVPALSSVFVYNIACREFLDMTKAVDYASLITRLSSLSAAVKAKNDSQFTASSLSLVAA